MREPPNEFPEAHIHIHGESDVLARMLQTSGRDRSKPADLHLPVGGRRFRHLCSPVATDPTWSRLSEADRRLLAHDGRPLWHELLVALRPNVVVLSVAKSHLEHIAFETLGPWQLIHSFDRKRDGTLRSYAYEVLGCWHLVGDEPALFVFCPASQTPLGSISDSQKRELGAIVADACRDAA